MLLGLAHCVDELATLTGHNAAGMLASLSASRRYYPALELDAPYDLLAARLQQLRRGWGAGPKAGGAGAGAAGVSGGCGEPLSADELAAVRAAAAYEAAGGGESGGTAQLDTEQLRWGVGVCVCEVYGTGWHRRAGRAGAQTRCGRCPFAQAAARAAGGAAGGPQRWSSGCVGRGAGGRRQRHAGWAAGGGVRGGHRCARRQRRRRSNSKRCIPFLGYCMQTLSVLIWFCVKQAERAGRAPDGMPCQQKDHANTAGPSQGYL